jgi:urease accessory protein
MKNDLRGRLARIGLALAALLPVTAHAHHVPGENHSILAGFSHPILGFDHLCAMLAVGLLAAQLGGRARWMLPSAFVAAMALGAALGAAGIALPFVEGGIWASLLVFGGVLAMAARLAPAQAAALVAVFAAFHGHAHGAEIPAQFSGLTFGLGVLAATALLHALGLLAGLGAQRLRQPAILRWAGAATLLAAFVLAVR